MVLRVLWLAQGSELKAGGKFCRLEFLRVGVSFSSQWVVASTFGQNIGGRGESEAVNGFLDCLCC